MMRWLPLLLLLVGAGPGQASQGELEQLLNQLKQERRSEQTHHRQREARFLAARDQQQAALRQAGDARQQAKTLASQLAERQQANQAEIQALETELSQASSDLQALFEHARQNAEDARNRRKNALLSAEHTDSAEELVILAEGQRLLDAKQLEGLWLSLLDEIHQSGRISRFEAPVIAPDGTQSSKTVVRIGLFTAISEGRYLRYLPEAQRLVEPARQPPLRTLENALAFEQAEGGLHALAIDPSRGELLGLLGRKPDMLQQIQQGGVIGYLILALGGFALLLVVERLLVLQWIKQRMRRQKRSEQAHENNPLGRLRLLAKAHEDSSTEALDLHLDESLSRESRRLSRGLTTLGVIAAMAPLLGLLGTVTGMIETFQSITLFGSGDPKLMSSGISEALVTTQLGLVVAVPVLLLHSFLKGRANRLIEQLDSEASLLLGSRS